MVTYIRDILTSSSSTVLYNLTRHGYIYHPDIILINSLIRPDKTWLHISSWHHPHQQSYTTWQDMVTYIRDILTSSSSSVLYDLTKHGYIYQRHPNIILINSLIRPDKNMVTYIRGILTSSSSTVLYDPTKHGYIYHPNIILINSLIRPNKTWLHISS